MLAWLTCYNLALENFHYLDDPMETAEGLATDIQLAKEHEAKCLRNVRAFFWRHIPYKS